MAGGPSGILSRAAEVPTASRDPLWVRVGLILVALIVLVLFLVLPLSLVFVEAFRNGWAEYTGAVKESDTIKAFKLTALVALLSVPLNTVFGLTASWAIAKFRFRGRSVLLSLIDLPFAISPVVSGLVFVLLFGARGWFGPWLAKHDLQIIFALPGMVLATIFVTFPFVARELIPLMEAQGSEQEEAARVLGAKGWGTFWRVTLPNIKWGLLYGVILCSARAIGEFGAVSVVSRPVSGETTVPIHIELLYAGFNAQAAFAVASLLALIGVATLILKEIVGKLAGRSVDAGESA